MIVDPDFPDHWKTRMLVGLLDGDEAAPVYVLRLWAHCQNRKQAIFSNINPEALKALCRFPGHSNKLEASLATSGFIRRDGDVLEVVNWESYNASLIAAWTNGKKGGRNPRVQKTKPRGSREDEIREEKNKTPLPPSLDTPAFQAAWQTWTAHRLEIKHPLKPTQEAQQIKLLAHLGAARSIELIEHTIAMGWRGLRDKDGRDLPAIAKTSNGSDRLPTIEDERKTWTANGGGSS